MAREARDYIEEGIEVTFALGLAVYLLSRLWAKLPPLLSEAEFNQLQLQMEPENVAAWVSRTPFGPAGESLFKTFDDLSGGELTSMFGPEQPMVDKNVEWHLADPSLSNP